MTESKLKVKSVQRWLPDLCFNIGIYCLYFHVQLCISLLYLGILKQPQNQYIKAKSKALWFFGYFLLFSSQLCLLFHLLFVTYIQSCGFYLLVISLVYPLLSILIFYHKCTSKMASLLNRRYLFNELIMFSIIYVTRYMQFLTPHETYICLISFMKYICLLTIIQALRTQMWTEQHPLL